MIRFVTMASVLAIALVSPTLARTGTTNSISVDYRDLDLSRADERQRLEHRITRAAATLCDTANERFDAKVRKAQRECRDDAVKAAMIVVAEKSAQQMAAR